MQKKQWKKDNKTLEIKQDNSSTNSYHHEQEISDEWFLTLISDLADDEVEILFFFFWFVWLDQLWIIFA